MMKLGQMYAIGILGPTRGDEPSVVEDLFPNSDVRVTDALLVTHSGENIWRGHLNLTRDEAKLTDIYLALGEHIYVLPNDKRAEAITSIGELLTLSSWSTNPLKGEPAGTGRNMHDQLVDSNTPARESLSADYEKITDIDVEVIFDLDHADSPIDRLQLFIMDLGEDGTVYISQEFFLAFLKRSVQWLRKNEKYDGIPDEEIMEILTDVVYNDPYKLVAPFRDSYRWAPFAAVWRTRKEEAEDHFPYAGGGN